MTSYLHYKHVRAREQSPSYEDPEPFYSRPLVRRNSKRQRLYLSDDDDEYDDYPPSTPVKATKPHTMSRALTIRQPNQLERFNVFNNDSHDEAPRRRDSSRSRHVSRYYISRDREPESDDDHDDIQFRLKLKATLTRPRSSSGSEKPMAMVWPGEVFKRKEKWEREDWEMRERNHGGDGFWDEECDREVRYRRMKRSRTDEWKPLKGFRRC